MALTPTPEEAVDLANRQNRATIADALKQMVLVIISLGFSNAFTILFRAGPDDIVDGRGPHIYSGVTDFGWTNLAIFAIYLLVGGRYLLTNWLYLASTYSDENKEKSWIMPDAVGIFLTGIVIGLQSSYATEKAISDFFLLFVGVLLVDVLSSGVSMYYNKPERAALRTEILWIFNNLCFGLVTFGLVCWSLPSSEHKSLPCWLVSALMLMAFLNSVVSLGITYAAYFASMRQPRETELRRLRARLRRAEGETILNGRPPPNLPLS